MTKEEIILSQSAIKERMRSRNEVHARYVKDIGQYRKLMMMENDPREQRLMLYNEIKALGWVLGKTVQTIEKELITKA